MNRAWGAVIVFFSGVSINFFFGLTSIFGYEYAGSDESALYIIYSVFLGGATFLVFFRKLFAGQTSLGRDGFWMFGIPLIFLCAFLLSFILNGGALSEASRKYALGFLLWSMPAFCAGIYFSIYKNKEIFRRLALFLCFFLFASSVTYLLGIFRQSNSNEESVLLLYQTASYQAALAFGLALFFLVSSEPGELSRFVKAALACMIPILFITSLAAGGRGGALLCLVYAVLLPLFLKDKRSRFNYLLVCLLLLIVFLILGDAAIGYLLGNTGFEVGLDRILLAFQGGQINWQGSSGRDEVFEEAIRKFVAAPFFGYGPFGYYSEVGYPPHNILLEVLLGFGLLGSLLWILFACVIWSKIRVISFLKGERVVFVFGVYALVHLMFSVTYLIHPEFWFFLGFCLGVSRLNERKNAA